MCQIDQCDQLAEVVLEGPKEDIELEVCDEHWSEKSDSTGVRIRAVRFVRRPRCCIKDCIVPAATTITEADGSVRPLCQRHLDNLSWIDPPQNLMSDEPGWSS